MAGLNHALYTSVDSPIGRVNEAKWKRFSKDDGRSDLVLGRPSRNEGRGKSGLDGRNLLR